MAGAQASLGSIEEQLGHPLMIAAPARAWGASIEASMDFSLFYAWQSDSPLDDNKHLIRDAAKEAVKRISRDNDLEESSRLDHDTKDLSGTPEVAASIFSKIERAGMFLGDVTFVGSSTSFDGREKKLPNMNVAIELGYAGKAIGWERVILVMNTAYGDPAEQVFDIRPFRKLV
jgi:hypothetical protein